MEYTMGKPIYVTDLGVEVYMEVTMDMASQQKRVGLMLNNPEYGLSKRVEVSVQKLAKHKEPLELLMNMGLDSTEVKAVTNCVKAEVQRQQVVSGGQTLPIEKVHRILTQEAILEDKFLEIKGIKYCAFQTDEFKEKIKTLELGYKNHLEILDNFRMLGILHGSKSGNSMRNDYRGSDHVPYYCFKPADNVDENSNVWDIDEEDSDNAN